MFCGPSCSPPNQGPLRFLTCEAPTASNLKCRGINVHWQSEERRWCLRNGQMLRAMAKTLNKPLTLVCSFLFDLTLQKFARILNPKCSQWNSCRVPFVRPDTCAFYDGIFDLSGNLRNPIHPFIFRLMIFILDHFLNIPCEGNEKLRKQKGHQIFEGKGGSCKDFLKMALSGKNAKNFLDGSTFGLGGCNLNPIGSELDKKKKEKDAGANDFPDGADGNELDLKKKKGGKGGDFDDDLDGSFDGEFDGEFDGVGNKRQKESIVEISDLYNDVVEDKRKLLVTAKPKKKPKRINRGRDDLRYMGVALPVLVHEPFDETKPWTWVRRHPIQTRVLEGTKLGRAKIHLYKRETLDRQLAEARERYSVRTLHSVGSKDSVTSEDWFSRKPHQKPPKNVSLVKKFNYKRLNEKHPAGKVSVFAQANPKLKEKHAK